MRLVDPLRTRVASSWNILGRSSLAEPIAKVNLQWQATPSLGYVWKYIGVENNWTVTNSKKAGTLIGKRITHNLLFHLSWFLPLFQKELGLNNNILLASVLYWAIDISPFVSRGIIFLNNSYSSAPSCPHSLRTHFADVLSKLANTTPLTLLNYFCNFFEEARTALDW